MSEAASSTPSHPRQRVNWSAAEKAEWLALFEASGQSAAEFCRDNDLSPATLSLWRQQGFPETEGGFVEVSLPAAWGGSTSAVTLHLPGGARLEVRAGTDPVWLTPLLRALMPAGG
jgi:hypothetical protein